MIFTDVIRFTPNNAWLIMILSAPHRVRFFSIGLVLATAFVVGSASAAPAKDADKKKTHDAKQTDKKPDQGKSTAMGQFGDWGAYQTQGKQKTCYALAQPKTREPDKLKRDAAYVFISYRPAENVKNEISIIMGFAMKDGGEAQATIGDSEFGLIAKGSNAWVKNPAEESHFIDAMKKGSKLIVKAASSKGKASTDTYSLAGLSQALDKVRKECP
jgi:invasion protein IalB